MTVIRDAQNAAQVNAAMLASYEASFTSMQSPSSRVTIGSCIASSGPVCGRSASVHCMRDLDLVSMIELPAAVDAGAALPPYGTSSRGRACGARCPT